MITWTVVVAMAFIPYPSVEQDVNCDGQLVTTVMALFPLKHDSFSVGKKRFRRAVDRNRIKRLMREAWRMEKVDLAKNWKPGSTQWAVVFIFVGNEIPSFSDCQQLIQRAAKRLASEMTSGE